MAEAWNRILFENSPDAVFVVAGSQDILLELNDRLPELLGRSREQLSRMCRADFELGIPTLSMRSSRCVADREIRSTLGRCLDSTCHR
jgi:PAS domain-containing protein